MKSFHPACIGLVALLGSAHPSLAQDFPDMIGTWTGIGEGVVIGDPLHFAPDAEGNDAPRRAAFEITIEIVNQDERFIWGTISGGSAVEPWLATLWSDGKGYMGVDSDGYMFGRILSENEVENCYAHTGATMVAACTVMTRQP